MLKLCLLLSLVTFSSCALFRSGPDLQKSQIDQVLNSIPVLGEGRGRLGVDQQQYLFSYEAVLKENNDWLMAIAIPLHGEEVMVLPDMKSAKAENLVTDSFGARIEMALADYFRKRPNLPHTLGKEFIRELRSLIRFGLSTHLNLKRSCQSTGVNAFTCKMDQEVYQVQVAEKNIRINKNLASHYVLELHAENLTGSRFARTNYLLHSPQVSLPVLSLELFWK